MENLNGSQVSRGRRLDDLPNAKIQAAEKKENRWRTEWRAHLDDGWRYIGKGKDREWRLAGDARKNGHSSFGWRRFTCRHNGPCLHHSSEFYSSLRRLINHCATVTWYLNLLNKPSFFSTSSHFTAPRLLFPRHADCYARSQILDLPSPRCVLPRVIATQNPMFSVTRFNRIYRWSYTHQGCRQRKINGLEHAAFKYSRLDRFCSTNYLVCAC